MDKLNFTALHRLVARDEAPEWGHFRGEGDETINRVFERGLTVLAAEVLQPFERAAAFFLFGALQQFFLTATNEHRAS